MSASLKSVLGRQIRGVRQLESKIFDLQNQYQALLKERQQDITTIIATLDLAHLDDPILVGGFLFLKEKTTSQDTANKFQVEAWRDAGEKFLRRSKPKICPDKGGGQTGNCPRPREHEGEKREESFPYLHKQNGEEQAGAYPQISSEKPSPQATHQPPQKQPQSREA